MPKFLVDENLSPKLAQHLRMLGYTASSVREVGLTGALDEEIITWSNKKKYIVITRDLGFGYVYSQREDKFGVILLRSKDESTEAAQVLELIS